MKRTALILLAIVLTLLMLASGGGSILLFLWAGGMGPTFNLPQRSISAAIGLSCLLMFVSMGLMIAGIVTVRHLRNRE